MHQTSGSAAQRLTGTLLSFPDSITPSYQPFTIGVFGVCLCSPYVGGAGQAKGQAKVAIHTFVVLLPLSPTWYGYSVELTPVTLGDTGDVTTQAHIYRYGVRPLRTVHNCSTAAKYSEARKWKHFLTRQVFLRCLLYQSKPHSASANYQHVKTKSRSLTTWGYRRILS